MKAILLAAGFGTRLRPITDTIPKCLVPIHGRPLLDYWLDLLDHDDIDGILVNTHYLASMVDTHIAASHHRSRIKIVHEPKLLGTGGTLAANQDFAGDGPLLLAHADNLTTFDVSGLVIAHANRPTDVAITMLAFRTDSPSSCGILETNDDGLVVAFHEKVANPPGNLANAAVYILEGEVIRYAAALADARAAAGETPFVDLSTEVIPAFLGRILAVETDGYHRDIGDPQSLAAAHQEFPSS